MEVILAVFQPLFKRLRLKCEVLLREITEHHHKNSGQHFGGGWIPPKAVYKYFEEDIVE